MRVWIIPFIFLVFVISSCRSDYERIRTSGDAELMLTTADSLFITEDYGKANILYEMIIPAFRGKSQAEKIAYNFAYGHYLDGSHVLSSHYFKAFADTYSSSPRKEEALYLSAISYYKLSPRYQLDQSDSQKAIDAFQAFVNLYPESPKVAEANGYIDGLRQKMELKAFDSGKMYYRTRNYSASIQSLENMLKDFPDSSYDEPARYIIVKSSMDWANNSVYTKKEERYIKTVGRATAYLKKHIGEERSKEITSIKSKCEQELKKIQNG